MAPEQPVARNRGRRLRRRNLDQNVFLDDTILNTKKFVGSVVYIWPIRLWLT
jgi:hypothetical protein